MAVRPVPKRAPSASNALKECMWIPMEAVPSVPAHVRLVIRPRLVPPLKKEKLNSEHLLLTVDLAVSHAIQPPPNFVHHVKNITS